MRFFGTLISWLAAAGVAYLVSSGASQTMVMNVTAAMVEANGGQLGLTDRIAGTFTGMMGLWPLLVVIATGFLIAFFVASLVKAMVPPLSLIAYPAAGAAAMAAILALIPVAIPAYEGLPGAETPLGYGLQIIAGILGGLVFEHYRPR
ncbi:MAG: hypothetical protein ACWA5T_09670 [Parvularcula sp.]